MKECDMEDFQGEIGAIRDNLEDILNFLPEDYKLITIGENFNQLMKARNFNDTPMNDFEKTMTIDTKANRQRMIEITMDIGNMKQDLAPLANIKKRMQELTVLVESKPSREQYQQLLKRLTRDYATKEQLDHLSVEVDKKTYIQEFKLLETSHLAVKKSHELLEINVKKIDEEFKKFAEDTHKKYEKTENFMDSTKLTLRDHNKRLDENKEEIEDESHVR